MAELTIKPKQQCMWDMVALGEVMLRLDPGDVRIATAREFRAWEGGGEYNVARGLTLIPAENFVFSELSVLDNLRLGAHLEPSSDVIRQRLLRYAYGPLEDALSRMDRYSSAGAAQMVASGRRVTFASGFLHGFWTFVRTYVLRAGFLDGREGLLLAIANAEGSYYRYMKAWLLARQGDHARSGVDGGAIRG